MVMRPKKITGEWDYKDRMGKSYLKKDKREIALDKWKSEGRRQSQYLEEGIGFDAYLHKSVKQAKRSL
ncbi:hypothetical protein NC653_037861 [Populus alba x Populus x berolinensis]|uniref:Uncharacterized protein n=1 Tax=Populus alba x Populus x berolinensis TaxID=444605 RepID=A0AAD6LFK7_9ROSI|nr:hypothetical protein NC653_037861 [Populus alba x Populus x berolinensis]